VWWFRGDGRRMTRRDWNDSGRRTLGVFLSGEHTGMLDERGSAIHGASFLLLFNSSGDDVTFRLPAARFGARWALELTTAAPDMAPGSGECAARDELFVTSRSLTLLRRR
jgi:isoamylase